MSTTEEEKETIIVLGCDGYIGSALILRLLNKGYRVVGIDNLSRRDTVDNELGSISAIPILSMANKMWYLKEYGDFEFYAIDVDKDYFMLNSVIKKYQPSTIVNLAQQPSAPFSHRSREEAINTINNNINGTLNCLYTIKENKPDIHLIQIGSMGEYDQSMGVDIEEGTFDFIHNGRTAKDVIFPRRAPSFYHGSKIASTYFIDLAVRSWGLNVTDIMQGIVYGNWTEEIEETGLQTRLDTDECFGTVLNRFIVQSLIGQPLTVYGEGEQQRGFLPLNDSIQCLMIAIENRAKGYRTWNQFATFYSISKLANTVQKIFLEYFHMKVNIEYIPTPRTENTNSVYYNPKVDKLKELGFQQTRTIFQEIRYILDTVGDTDLSTLEKVVMPKIKW